jgi:hypothetical protein
MIRSGQIRLAAGSRSPYRLWPCRPCWAAGSRATSAITPPPILCRVSDESAAPALVEGVLTVERLHRTTEFPWYPSANVSAEGVLGNHIASLHARTGACLARSSSIVLPEILFSELG